MNLRPPRGEEPEINLIPLIDILFFLLLFFMLSSTFDRASELKIDLPQAAPQAKSTANDVIEVVIDSAGHYSINQRQLVNTQLDTIKRALRQAAGNRANPPLLIMADAHTPYQAVVSVMDAARQLGFVHLSIATRDGENSR